MFLAVRFLWAVAGGAVLAGAVLAGVGGGGGVGGAVGGGVRGGVGGGGVRGGVGGVGGGVGGVGGAEGALDRRDDVGDLGEPSGAEPAAGQLPFPGRDDGRTPFAEGIEVALGRRVVQHVGVHRGRDEGRGPDREVEGGEEVVGEAERHPGDDVGGGGGHHEDVGLLGERDVADAAGGVGSGSLGLSGGGVGARAGARVGKEVFEDGFAGDGGERERGDELAGGAGQDDLNPEPALFEGAHQVRSLVGPDAPGNPENDLLLHPLILGGTRKKRARTPNQRDAARQRSASLRPAQPERAAKPRTDNPCGGRAARERQSSDGTAARRGA